MTAPWRFLLALSAALTFLGAAPRSRAQEGDPGKAFLRDYGPHVADLRARFADVEVKYTRKSDVGNGNVQVLEAEAKSNARNFLIKSVQDRVMGKGGGVEKELSTGTDCVNPFYFFSVVGLNEGYKLKRLTMANPKAVMPSNWLQFPHASTCAGKRTSSWRGTRE